MDINLTRLNIITWGIAITALALSLWLHLLPALLAGLFANELVNMLERLIPPSRLGNTATRVLAVSLVAMIIVASLAAAVVGAAAFIQNSGESIPDLVDRMAQIVDESRPELPIWVNDYLPDDAGEISLAISNWIKSHRHALQVAGTEAGRIFVHVIMGLVIGGLLSLPPVRLLRERGPLTRVIAYHADQLSKAFRNVVFAQVRISLINTIFTGIYLALVLPYFDITLPFTKTLIALTFVVGLIPIIGNLISNTVIFIVSLSHSLLLALSALLFLVVIHKLEYFLNAKIIGSQIDAQAWELLLAMLVMESAFGIPGLIAAPIFYAYIKDELKDKGLV